MQYLRHPGATTDGRLQVPSLQPFLFHHEQDGGDRIRKAGAIPGSDRPLRLSVER
jgi:hypothetical protein